MWEVGISSIEGQGIIATKLIKKGVRIGTAYYIIGQLNDKYIAGDISILGAMHNHSVTPTAKPVLCNNAIHFEAIDTIGKGTEITCDYNEYCNVLNIEKPKKEW